MTTKFIRFTQRARGLMRERFNSLMGLLCEREALRESFERQDNFLGEPGGTNLSRSQQTGARRKTKKIRGGGSKGRGNKIRVKRKRGGHQSSPRSLCG